MRPFHRDPPPLASAANHALAACFDAPTVRPSGAHRRVALVLLAVAIMGIADLLFTLTYMTGPGMMEVNPIARTAISLGGVSMLIKFKLLTILLSAGILYCCRKHRSAEIWSWVCAGVMFVLTLHWMHYNSIISDMTHELTTIALSDSAPPEWVKLSPAGS